MGIHTPKRDTGMENEITHEKRCGIGERGKEGPCDSLTEINSHRSHVKTIAASDLPVATIKLGCRTGVLRVKTTQANVRRVKNAEPACVSDKVRLL